MPFFDAPGKNFPRSWSEYSRDYQIFLTWEISLFALIFFSGTGVLKLIPALYLEGALGLWFLILLGLAIHNRRQRDWRWRGLTGGDWVKAGIGAALMIAFLYVFSQGLWPLKSITIPMFLFALSIVAFNILSSLKVVQHSEEDFAQSCGDIAPTPLASYDEADDIYEPKWKRTVRGIYSILFILIWLEGVAFFYVHQRYTHEGSLKPTATQTESFNEHGTLVYLAHDQMQINNALLTMMMVGIPSLLLGGFILHFVVGVRMFSNMPETRGLFGRDSKP